MSNGFILSQTLAPINLTSKNVYLHGWMDDHLQIHSFPFVKPSNQTSKCNRSNPSNYQYQTQRWNGPITTEWNHDIPLHFVPEPNTPLMRRYFVEGIVVGEHSCSPSVLKTGDSCQVLLQWVIRLTLTFMFFSSSSFYFLVDYLHPSGAYVGCVLTVFLFL